MAESSDLACFMKLIARFSTVVREEQLVLKDYHNRYSFFFCSATVIEHLRKLSHEKRFWVGIAVWVNCSCVSLST